MWDPSIPTDEDMTEKRPDLVVEDQLCKSIYIIEMSVPTDSNINGRWQEKFQKYQKLAADMRKQFRGYRIKVVPMIIGALGTLDTLLEDLREIPKLSKSAVEVMRAMQRTVLWTMSSPVPVLACRPLESSGGFVYGGTPSYYDGQLWPDVHLSSATNL